MIQPIFFDPWINVLKKLTDKKNPGDEKDYHFFHKKNFGDQNDLYFGAFAGYTWSRSMDQFRSLNIGAETGYKYQFEKPVFINSKILITSPLHKPKIIPGLEFLIGYATGI